MKVLYIASGDYKYGASKSMMSLLLYLKEYHHVEPILLTKKYNKLNKICNDLKIENYSCWYCDFMSGSPYSCFLFKFMKHMVKFSLYIVGSLTQYRIDKCGIDFSTIDIVHTNLNRISAGAYLSSKFKIPHVWHIREFGKEDYNVLFYKPHTIKYMNENADVFITISDAVRKCWIQKGLDKHKLKTVYNGIETQKYIPKKTNNNNNLKLVIAGHIQPNKGQLQLVKAIALLPIEIRNCISVDIIGEGYWDYIYKIKKTIKKYSLYNIHLLGYCDNMSPKLSEYDVGIICSKSEAFGRITIEYIRAGLYVIASNTGANPELIQHKKLGILYEYGNIKSLAKCIEHIFYHKDVLHTDHSTNNIFTIEDYAENIYKIYQELLSRL